MINLFNVFFMESLVIITKKKSYVMISITIFISCFILLLQLQEKGNIKEVKLSLPESEYFSKLELKDAADEISDYFKKNQKGAILKSITFDQELHENEIKSRFSNGLDSKDPLGNKPENIIYIKASFNTGSSKIFNLSSHTEVDYWQYVLSRKNKNSPWYIIDQGI